MENIQHGPWEKFQAEAVPQEQGPWTNYSEPEIFSPSKKNWAALKKAFAGEPLAFIDNPQVRADVDFATSKYADAETERKKWALAAYFAQMRKEDIYFCRANLDQLIEKFNGGKMQSVDAAYTDIGNTLNFKRTPATVYENRAVAAAVAGSGRGWEGAFNLARFVSGVATELLLTSTRADISKHNPDAVDMIRDPQETRKQVESAVMAPFEKYIKPDMLWAEENMRLPEDWATNSASVADWVQNFTIATINYLPQLAAQTALMTATGGTASLFAVFGINGYYNIKDDHPEMSEGQALVYGTAIGLINGGLEKITQGILAGKVSKKIAEEGVKKGVRAALAYLAKGAAKEGLEEAGEQIAENILDISFGLRGDRSNFKSSDYFREIMRGVPESALLALPSGAAFAGAGYQNARQIAARQDALRSVIDDKVRELSQKTDRTDEEQAQFAALQVLDEAASTADLEKAVSQIYLDDVFSQQTENMSDEEKELFRAQEAEKRLRLAASLPYNMEDVVDKVEQYALGFKDTVFHVVESWRDVNGKVPEETRGGAFTDLATGEIYINASKVRPHRVFEVMLHEAVGHKGLREIFKNSELDQILDSVYREHFNDEEFKEVARRYFDLVDLVDEEGRTYQDISLEQLDDQRLAAEEYIAYLAEKNVKPSWWKELLQKIRMAFAKLPYFSEVSMTDRQIELVLARSARKVRRGMFDRRSRVETDGNGLERTGTEEVRFSVAPEVDTAEFKAWFAGSKVVDENGDPMVVYHGTNWDIFSEPSGEAVFSDKYRGSGSGDNGFFGRGFYFTFGNGKASEGEAGYYGKNVYPFYLSIKNPFYFSESLYDWNGKRVLGDEVNSVEIVNAVKLFPELLKDFTLSTYDKNGDFAGEITLDKYSRMFIDVYYNKKFSIRKSSNPDEFVIEADPVKHEENGHTWIEYGFSERIYNPGSKTDFQLLATHLYFQNRGFSRKDLSVEIPYRLLRDFYGEPEFRSWLESNGYDGVMQSKNGDEVVAFYPNQIKSATDNVGTFDPENPDVRYSISEYSAEEVRDYVDILKPFTGTVIDRNPEDYAAYLKEHGVDIPDDDAFRFAQEAARQKMKEARKAADARRDNWLYENIMEYRWAVEFAGSSNFKIKVSPRFEKVEKSGTFWVGKKDKGGTVISLEELAKHVARETGKDELDVEQSLFDFFKDLTKPELRKNYTEFKNQQLAADKEEAKRAFDEFMQQEQYRLEDEAVAILSAGQPVTREWVDENRKVFNKLYEMIFKKDAPYVVSKKDFEALNAALIQEGASADTYAQAYKVAREKAYEEYQDKLRSIRDKVMQQKADVLSLQREAASFAEKNLPKENRSEFTRDIIRLLEYSNAPSSKFPEGRRKAEFDRIISGITKRAGETRRKFYLDKIAARLQQLGERVDAGRKVRGMRDIETQKTLNRIIQISRLDGASLNAAISLDQQKIEELISIGESTVELEYDIALLNRYGELWKKSADEVKVAFDELQSIARTGKDNLLREINARAAQDENDRHELWHAVNGGKIYSSTDLHKMKNKRSKAASVKKLLDKSYWPTLSLDGMFSAMAVFSSEENVLDRFRRMAHKAKLDKDAINMRNADDCRKVLCDLIGTKSSFTVADTIGNWRKLEKNTGVRRFVPDPREQQFKYERLTVDEARKQLALYDAGKSKMPDYEAEAVRQQLLTIDRKIKYEVPSEFRDGATDKIIELINKDSEEKEPVVVIPRPTFRGTSEELELSQMQALYLKLMWDQKDIRYKMHYNGYSDETMAQIDAFLLPEVKAFGVWMRNQLELDRGGIEKVFEKIYFAKFPKEENYFPSVYNVTGNQVKASSVDLTQEGAAAGAVAYTPGALKVRVYHLKDLQIADALTVFQNHRLMMNHFVTHAEPARKMRSVLLNDHVKQAIEGVHGETAYREIKTALQDFINGGNADVAVNDIGSYVYSAAVRAKMAFNLVSGLKQTMGAITYLQEIPPDAFARGMAYAVKHPKEVFETLGNTDYFKTRWNGGANAELRLILDSAGKQGSVTAQFGKMIDELGSLPLRFGDAASVLFGGFAVYKYHYDNLVRHGADESDARREALVKWEMATERTQQSSAPFLLNRYQRGGYTTRLFTTFMSNQILLWNHNAANIYKYLVYGNNAALKDATMGIAALVLSSAAMAAFDQIKEHWNDGEYAWLDMFWNVLADSISGFGPAGSIASSAVSALKPGGYQSSYIWNDLIYGGYAVKRQVADEDAKLSDNDWADAVRILQAAGYFYNPAAQAGAVAREVRKLFRMVKE